MTNMYKATFSAIQGNDLVNGPSLLNGSYDEEESANSFAQALQEWRDQNKASKTSPRNPPICTGNCYSQKCRLHPTCMIAIKSETLTLSIN